MVLCEVCARFVPQSIIRERAEWGDDGSGWVLQSYDKTPLFCHRKSIVNLTNSSVEGCEFCGFLYQILQKPSGWEAPPAEEDKVVIRCGSVSGKAFLYAPFRFEVNSGPYSGYFDACALEGFVPKTAILGRSVSSRSDSETCISIAKEWLSTCTTEHHQHQCPQLLPSGHDLPTRVISVGPLDGSQDPKVVIPPKGSRGNWTALSYCWGPQSSDPTTLRKDTLSKYKQLIPMGNLPQTIRDAVTITRHLGIAYLWVDALCILQDDLFDWNSQATLMPKIYQNASVTIVAAGSTSSSSGIFSSRVPGVRTSSHSLQIDSTIEPSGSSNEKVQFVQNMEMGFENLDLPINWPWSTRAWTLQEEQLSPRLLIYGVTKMMWRCDTLIIDETGANKYANSRIEHPRTSSVAHPRVLSRSERIRNLLTFHSKSKGRPMAKASGSKKGPDWIDWSGAPSGRMVEPPKSMVHSNPFHRELHTPGYDNWYNRIIKYNQRHLTVVGDMLPAISGVASEIAVRINDEYLAGLWKKDIIRGLMWIRKVAPESNQPLRKNTAAPTWSWACASGGKLQWLFPNPHCHYVASCHILTELVDTRIQTVRGSNAYGRVDEGVLELKGPLFTLPSEALEHAARCIATLRQGNTSVPQDGAIPSSLSHIFHMHVGHPGQRFALLQLVVLQSESEDAIIFTLVLETTGRKDNEWRRLTSLYFTFEEWASQPESTSSQRDPTLRDLEQRFRKSWPISKVDLV